MAAAPLIAGNDLRKMSPEVLKILTNKDAVAIDQDSLGKQGYLFMDHLSKLIYVKELSNGCWAICWHNSGDLTYTQRINWSHFTFLKGEYEIKDIWKNKIIGTTTKNIEVNIASHDILLFRLNLKNRGVREKSITYTIPKVNTMKMIFINAVLLLSFIIICQAKAQGQTQPLVREKLLMDLGWCFALGHSLRHQKRF